MSIDLAQMRGWVTDVVSQRRPIEASMTTLLDRCESARPHADWESFRSLPYADLSALRTWLERPFREEPPLNPLRGLWFGIFNPCTEDGAASADLYVCGSEQFESDPDDADWACDPDWWPDSRYAGSAVLAEIYRIANPRVADDSAEEDSLGNDAEYPLCLAYGALAVRDLLAECSPSLILGTSDSLGVAVGFDGGDFVLLGEFGPTGLKS